MKKTDASDFAGIPEARAPLFERDADESGPFARSSIQPSPHEILVAGLIWLHQGRANPIPLARLREATRLTDRALKDIVRELRRTHWVMIGASRGQPSGYFIIRDELDLAVGVGPYRDQAIDAIQTVKLLAGKETVIELLGQMRMEVEKE